VWWLTLESQTHEINHRASDESLGGSRGKKMKEKGKEKEKMEIKGQNKCKIGKI
jgi:hypothetical protein